MTSLHKIILTLLALLPVTAVVGQTARKLTLANSDDGQSQLFVYLAEHPTGRAILDCPGGGYTHLSMDNEGRDWAPYFNKMGISYVVLQYRMPHGNRNIPLGDAYKAMKTLRDSAQAWHVNPDDIGIMGFSAGGHLASSVSTHAPWTLRPNFSILFYPVITMGRGTHEGSRRAFLGSDQDNDNIVKLWSNERQVRSHLTPPALIVLANDDGAVPPVYNAIPYYSAMRRCGNDCSLIVYPTGGHGFGFRSSFPSHQQMTDELAAWLKALPSPKAGAVRVACIGNSITDGMGIDMNDRQGYPAQLQTLLGNDYLVKNFGVSARTLLHKGDLPYRNEEAWQDAQAFLPNIAIVMLGTNDSKPENWRYGADYANDLRQLTDSLKALPSHPQVWLCSPIPAVKPSWGINDSIIGKVIAPIIQKVARKEKVHFLDLHTLYPPTSDAEYEGLMQNDGIHPTRKGAHRLAELIGNAIRKKGK